MTEWGQGVTSEDLEALKALLEREARLLGKFVLSSGIESNYYFDAKPVTMNPRGIQLVASVMLPVIRRMGANCVGGLEFGAAPIALELAKLSYRLGDELPACVVRKKPREHGTKDLIMASSTFKELPAKRIAVVDDVVTKGGSVRDAMTALEKAGCDIAGIVALVTRPEQGGVAAMARSFPYPYQSVYECDFQGNLTPLIGNLAAVS